MQFKAFILFLFSLSAPGAWASLYEMYGASSASLASGGQISPSFPGGEINTYAPSLMSLNKKAEYHFSSFAVKPSFDKINPIVMTNELNSSDSSAQYGKANTDYPWVYLYSLQAQFPIITDKSAKFGLSLAMPMDKVSQVNTGDAYRPEYIMYRSRVLRPHMEMNISFELASHWFMAVGTRLGLSTKGESYLLARDNGASAPSSGKMKMDARPSSAYNLSIGKKWNQHHVSSLSFQEELKTELEMSAQGVTPVGGPSLRFDWDIYSLLYYDPRIYRLVHLWKREHWSHAFSLEYQDWSRYKTPKLKIDNGDGILRSSEDYESLKTKNIWVLKLATSYTQKKHSFILGYSYRPSPIDADLNGNSNSIDLDKHIFSVGHQYQMRWWQEKVILTTAYQHHLLQDKTVSKSDGLENGESGQKIGSPGYETGGTISIFSLGLSWLL